MRNLLILTAGVALAAACAHRTEEGVGAAPNRDTTAVRADTTAARADTAVTHAIDTTRTGPPGEAGRPGNATVTADSAGIPDTTQPTNDSLNRAVPPQDTTRPGAAGAPSGADTTRMGNDSTGIGRSTSDSMGAMHDTMSTMHDTMSTMHDSAGNPQ